MAPRHLDWALLLYLSIAWGMSFMLIALSLASFPPVTLVWLRLTMGAAVLYGVMRFKGLRLPREWAWWRNFALLSVMGNLLPFTLIAWGELHVSSSLAGILMALMPISVMVLAHFFISAEPITLRKFTGFSLGFVGVLVLVGAEALDGLGGNTLLAQLAIVLSTFCYAINSILSKRLPPIHVLVVATGTLITGSVLLLPVSMAVDHPWTLDIQPTASLAVATLGLFATGLATWVYFTIISLRGPSFLSMINYIIPVIAFAAGVWLLNEAASWDKFVALAAIMAGIAISQRRPPVGAQSALSQPRNHRINENTVTVQKPIKLHPQFQRYSWGTSNVITQLLNLDPVPGPEPVAELWMGAHPSLPSPLVESIDGQPDLYALINHRPVAILGSRHEELSGRLPYLFKVLSAGQALSVQVHPSKAQAEAGFAAENAQGIALSDPTRNYKDSNHKPELLLAMTEFHAMAGFRQPGAVAERLDSLASPELTHWAEVLRQRGVPALTDLYAFLLRLRSDQVSALLVPVLGQLPLGEDFAWVARLHSI
ncbi:MAG: mannose-6-phosphate isomerase, class I, partial [Natronospirillum sp.]